MNRNTNDVKLLAIIVIVIVVCSFQSQGCNQAADLNYDPFITLFICCNITLLFFFPCYEFSDSLYLYELLNICNN